MDSAPAFLCDRMLIRLARWLRAAGHDAAIAHDHHSDRALIQRARAEGRLLLTCDRKMLEIRDAADSVVLIRDGRLAPSAAELSGRVALDWLKAPLTRCLDCNVRLKPAPDTAWRQAPMWVDAVLAPLNRCPRCGRLTWQGSHAKRMRARLAHWQSGAFV